MSSRNDVRKSRTAFSSEAPISGGHAGPTAGTGGIGHGHKRHLHREKGRVLPCRKSGTRFGSVGDRGRRGRSVEGGLGRRRVNGRRFLCQTGPGTASHATTAGEVRNTPLAARQPAPIPRVVSVRGARPVAGIRRRTEIISAGRAPLALFPGVRGPTIRRRGACRVSAPTETIVRRDGIVHSIAGVPRTSGHNHDGRPVSAFDDPFHRALYLTGPTASGKTAVGVALARRIGAEVVALDSMTLYRGMDVGTAKPTAERDAGRAAPPDRRARPLGIGERRATIAAGPPTRSRGIEAAGKRVLFVGGTALYLKALLRGLFRGPAADPELRARLEAEADRSGRRGPAREARRGRPGLGRAAAPERPPAGRPRPGSHRGDRPAAQRLPDRARPPRAGGRRGLRPGTAPRRTPRADRPRGSCGCSTDGLVDEVRALIDRPPAARPGRRAGGRVSPR